MTKDQSSEWKNQRTLTVGGRITVQLISSFTGFDLTKKENMLLFVKKIGQSRPLFCLLLSFSHYNFNN